MLVIKRRFIQPRTYLYGAIGVSVFGATLATLIVLQPQISLDRSVSVSSQPSSKSASSGSSPVIATTAGQQSNATGDTTVTAKPAVIPEPTKKMTITHTQPVKTSGNTLAVTTVPPQPVTPSTDPTTVATTTTPTDPSSTTGTTAPATPTDGGTTAGSTGTTGTTTGSGDGSGGTTTDPSSGTTTDPTTDPLNDTTDTTSQPSLLDSVVGTVANVVQAIL